MECFNAAVLNRAQPDVSADADATFSPVDENYPERYYLPPVCALPRNDVDAASLHFLGGLRVRTSFVLPPTMNCQGPGDCVMRWRYVTGNSCHAPGYRDFFGPSWSDFNANVFPNLPLGSECSEDQMWTELGMAECGPEEGGFAEEFINCADVMISNDGGDVPVSPAVPEPPVPEPEPEPQAPVGCLMSENCVLFAEIGTVFWSLSMSEDFFRCEFCFFEPELEEGPAEPTTGSPAASPTASPTASQTASPTTPPPPSPNPNPVVGYYSWNWGAGSTGPPQSQANVGISFTGHVDVQLALDGYTNGAAWCCPTLTGTPYLSLGGGNSAGLFTVATISAIEEHLPLIISAGYEGIVYDVEHVKGNSAEIISAFVASFKAAKDAGLGVIVTTSHSAPYEALDENGVPDPLISTALVMEWCMDENIDMLSPQLYSNGFENVPEFAETNFCKGEGCVWDLYKNCKARFVPSINDESHLAASQAFFKNNYEIQVEGFIQWKQQLELELGEEPGVEEPVVVLPEPEPEPEPPVVVLPEPESPSTCPEACRTCTHWASKCNTCCSRWGHCGATSQHCDKDLGGVDCSGCSYRFLRGG